MGYKMALANEDKDKRKLQVLKEQKNILGWLNKRKTKLLFTISLLK
jgi:hypothetical protein